MDDRQIIELFFHRDERAIRETESKYGRLCYRIANNVLNDVRDAQESVNDTYLGLWNTIPPQKPRNFTAYVCKIARNASLKKYEYNSAQKRNSHFETSLSELEEVLPDRSIRQDVTDERLGVLINAFLKKEKRDIRNVFIRRYYMHEDIAGIAKKYGFSESKVKSMLFHARNKLKKFLVAKGVTI